MSSRNGTSRNDSKYDFPTVILLFFTDSDSHCITPFPFSVSFSHSLFICTSCTHSLLFGNSSTLDNTELSSLFVPTLITEIGGWVGNLGGCVKMMGWVGVEAYPRSTRLHSPAHLRVPSDPRLSPHAPPPERTTTARSWRWTRAEDALGGGRQAVGYTDSPNYMNRTSLDIYLSVCLSVSPSPRQRQQRRRPRQ